MLCFISFSQVALVSGRIFAGSILVLMLYETNKYSPGHQRHLVEVNKTKVQDPPFDEVSTPLNQITICSQSDENDDMDDKLS